MIDVLISATALLRLTALTITAIGLATTAYALAWALARIRHA